MKVVLSGLLAITYLASPLSAQVTDTTKNDWGIGDCLSRNAVLLGQDNQEDASTVVTGAFSKCTAYIDDAKSMASLMVLANRAARENGAYHGKYEPPPFPDANSEAVIVERWKEEARSKAIAALLEARAARK